MKWLSSQYFHAWVNALTVAVDMVLMYLYYKPHGNFLDGLVFSFWVWSFGVNVMRLLKKILDGKS